MTVDEKRQVLAQFVVHLRNKGISFVDNSGKVLARRMSSEKDPMMVKILEYVEEENDTTI